ncbi:hypothetical protein [Streptomyces winkii]|uniref:hypothetical protein n=1 Tax=Streptomyces winkii TaxID=3051178 RepID=UPI0028D12840|nr:hypothetical protein [Streptomyces sp. DSM 40971]
MRTAAVLIAATGLALSTATSAHAASWKNEYWRDGDDGDKGGVSGSAARYWSGDEDVRAYIGFSAKGEHVIAYNDTSVRASYLVTADGWPVAADDLAPGGSESGSLGLDENRAVSIKICVKNRGCATLSTLKS